MCIALRVWCCFLHHFLHARLMADTICVASKITKGDYGCKFAEVSDISALLRQNMGLHSIGVISNLSTAVCIMHACAVAPLFLYQKICSIAAAEMGCCRSVEEIGPSTIQKLAATSDATSIHHHLMPPQQVMTHHPVSQWTPYQHRLGHRPVSQGQGQGCWERCLGRSQVQGLNGSWITS